jgi:hypothetical protein
MYVVLSVCLFGRITALIYLSWCHPGTSSIASTDANVKINKELFYQLLRDTASRGGQPQQHTIAQRISAENQRSAAAIALLMVSFRYWLFFNFDLQCSNEFCCLMLIRHSGLNQRKALAPLLSHALSTLCRVRGLFSLTQLLCMRLAMLAVVLLPRPPTCHINKIYQSCLELLLQQVPPLLIFSTLSPLEFYQHRNPQLLRCHSFCRHWMPL